MDFDVGEFVASLVISGVGFVFFSYGRKMGRAPQILGGLILMIYPYFVSGLVPMIGVGLGVLALLMLALRLGH